MEKELKDILREVSGINSPRFGTPVSIFANHYGHPFDIGETVTLVERSDRFYFVKNRKGNVGYITEDEFIYIME